jgi:nucleotide-binding universal stress UspA family protein
MFHKILLPLDGAESAEWALEPALKLAEAARGELLLLRSVIPVYMSLPVFAGEYDWVWPEYAREEMREEARTYLQDVAKRHARPGMKLRSLAPEGDVAGLIVDTAVDEDVDLIVMSTQGWSGVKKGTLGTIAERVLHNAPCPVLVMRSPQPITRVLVTLDGSLLAEQVIEPALAVAGSLGARLILLRVNESVLVNPRQMIQVKWLGSEEGRALMQHQRQEAEAYLRDVVYRYAPGEVEIQTEVVDGPTVERIMEYATLHSIDLIAMSTHGHTGIRRWLYGSVTARILRRSQQAMLIVRPPAQELS